MWGQVYWNSPTQEMICGYGHEQKLKYPCSRDSKIIQMPYPWARAIDQIAALCPASPLPAGLPPYRYITAEATWSHWLSIFVSTAIDSVNVVISLECFEHELTWLAFKNITRGSTLSETDRHLCMPDERIRRDTCQSFLPKTPNSVTSEFSSPVSAVYAWNAWDHDPPFGEEICCIFWLGLSVYGSPSSKILKYCHGVPFKKSVIGKLNLFFK